MQTHEKPRDYLHRNFTVVQPPLCSTQILAILRQCNNSLSMEMWLFCGSNEGLTDIPVAEVPGYTEPLDPPTAAKRV